MNANELRVTNLVLYKNLVINPVIFIGYDSVELITPKGDTVMAKLDEIFPIVLTDEWLVKMGWEWDIFYQGYFGYNYVVNSNYREGYRVHYCKTRNDFIVENIQYVHQLQNLIYALTDNEIIINL